MELFIFGLESAQGITSSNDPQVIAYFDSLISNSFPGSNRTDSIGSMSTSLGSAAIINYVGNVNGTASDIIVYVAVSQGQALYMVAILDQGSSTARDIGGSIFATVGYGSSGQTQDTSSAGDQTNTQEERNPMVVGNWTRTESYVSGEFSGASQWFLSIYADGTYQTGDGNFAGGGPGVGGSSSGGDVQVGEWKTQGNILYARDSGASQWVAYAQYYVEASKLMLTFGADSREIWYRN
jgi:hypothetical protein